MRAFQWARMHNTYIESHVSISPYNANGNTETYLLQAPLENVLTEGSYITHTQHYYVGRRPIWNRFRQDDWRGRNHLRSFQLAPGKLTCFMIHISDVSPILFCSSFRILSATFVVTIAATINIQVNNVLALFSRHGPLHRFSVDVEALR